MHSTPKTLCVLICMLSCIAICVVKMRFSVSTEFLFLFLLFTWICCLTFYIKSLTYLICCLICRVSWIWWNPHLVKASKLEVAKFLSSALKIQDHLKIMNVVPIALKLSAVQCPCLVLQVPLSLFPLLLMIAR